MADYPEGNFWISGKTLVLEKIDDVYILEFVLTNPKARADFDIIFPYLSEERQAYLTDLIERHPFVKTKEFRDPKDVSDARQRKANTAGIRVPLSPRVKKILAQKQKQKDGE